MGGKNTNLSGWHARTIFSAPQSGKPIAEMSSRTLSPYFRSLPYLAKGCYLKKLGMLGVDFSDPYSMADKGTPSATTVEWPATAYGDIYNFLINSTSLFTRETLKAYKSMEGYKYLASGWVTDLRVLKLSSFLITAKVRHSQSLQDPFLLPWVCAEDNGTVLCAHCTCMAGLGEACSHIAAVLFAIDVRNRIDEDTSCTSVPCWWTDLSSKDALYAPTAEIDFTHPKRKLYNSGAKTRAVEVSEPCQKPSANELAEFYEELGECKNPSILSLQPAFLSRFSSQSVPAILSDLYNDSMASLPYTDLVNAGEVIFDEIEVTEDHCKTIEQETRAQSKSRRWFLYRTGRVTASNFKAAAKTNSEASLPSISLIKRVCYPEIYKFYSSATSWGIDHEGQALEQYSERKSSLHMNLLVSKCGLIVNRRYAHLGASPNALISCDCCGKGVVEIKCPFRCKEESIREVASKGDFCLKVSSNGELSLDTTHSYYYQIQLQMFLSSTTYGGFIVWAPAAFHVERIVVDNDFVRTATERVNHFYLVGLMPELLGKWYTQQRPTLRQGDDTGDQDDEQYCFCKRDDVEGDMIECGNGTCIIQWFH